MKPPSPILPTNNKIPPQPSNGQKSPASAAHGTRTSSTLSENPTTSFEIVSNENSPPKESEKGDPHPVECQLQQVEKSTWSSVLRQKVDSVFPFLLLQKEETSKKIIKHSWPLFWMRCLVHFVPIAASIALIVLNLRGYFIGRVFQGPTNTSPSVHVFFLQIAAKLMVCS